MSERYTLLQGDCLELLPDAVAAKSIDLVLADLPYGSTDCVWDSEIDLERLWPEYRRVLAPGGCVLLFADMGFASTLIQSNARWYSHDIVWNKNKCGSPGLAKYRPMRVHEFVLCFAPGRYVYNPQMEKGEPYTRKPPKQIRCNHHGYGFAGTKSEGIVNLGTRMPKSVQLWPRDFSAQQQQHPTQKPVPFLRWLIRTYSNPGARVLDNATGIASTGVACIQEGREFIGMELDRDKDGNVLGYIDIGNRRLSEAAAQMALREAA